MILRYITRFIQQMLKSVIFCLRQAKFDLFVLICYKAQGLKEGHRNQHIQSLLLTLLRDFTMKYMIFKSISWEAFLTFCKFYHLKHVFLFIISEVFTFFYYNSIYMFDLLNSLEELSGI